MFCGQTIGKISRLLLFYITFKTTIFTVNKIYPFIKKCAPKKHFWRFYAAVKDKNATYSKLNLPDVKKLIACATIQGLKNSPESPCSESVLDVICAICTNRSQVTLFFDSSLVLTSFSILFIPFITFYCIFFKMTFFQSSKLKAPPATSSRGRGSGVFLRYFTFIYESSSAVSSSSEIRCAT